MEQKELRFGVIGCGLMGREFASAAARWLHLADMKVRPRIVAVCDTQTSATEWFVRHLPDIRLATKDYKELLADPDIDAIYCAVPHNLHESLYTDIIRAGKHLLGEKPFGIDQEANRAILEAAAHRPDVVVRCSSEFPFYPGAYQIGEWVRKAVFGQIIEVEAGFWHSSDLNPEKPINWKRRIETNGEYGCMGDLGLHVLHLPLRFGWKPRSVRALLKQVVSERPDHEGRMVPCETWDNAVLACDVQTVDQAFPLLLSTKRVAPGHANTWFIRIIGTAFSAEFSTKNPKQVKYLPYTPGTDQAWRTLDAPYASAYPTITGGIFEFGFSDSILQMWAAFCDEVVQGSGMTQPLRCVTLEESAVSHAVFTAALESQREGQTVFIA